MTSSFRSRVIKASQVALASDAWEMIAAVPTIIHNLEPDLPLDALVVPATPTAPPAGQDLPGSQHALSQARQEAAEIVRQAREQAGETLRQANEHAVEIERQARQKGLAAAEAEAGQLLLTAKGIYDEVCDWRETMLAASEESVLNLAAAVARAVFGQGLALPGETLQAAFDRALADAKPLGDLRIHVHPEDAALLGPHWPEQQAGRLGQQLELVPDQAVRRGGCLVEGQHGSVDARVETQLHLALDSLFAASHLPADPPQGASRLPAPENGAAEAASGEGSLP